MSDPLDAIRWRDELLQILYWFRGEGFGEAVAAHEIVPFLGADEASGERHLTALAEDGYAVRLEGEPARYRLTALGVKEGGRRFADEFAGLTGQAHGECNDPKCACRTLGPQACEAHADRAHRQGNLLP
jgi:hypothetical protein